MNDELTTLVLYVVSTKICNNWFWTYKIIGRRYIKLLSISHRFVRFFFLNFIVNMKRNVAILFCIVFLPSLLFWYNNTCISISQNHLYFVSDLYSFLCFPFDWFFMCFHLMRPLTNSDGRAKFVSFVYRISLT